MRPIKSGLAAFAAAVVFCCQSGAGAAPGEAATQPPAKQNAAPDEKPGKQTAQPASNPPTPVNAEQKPAKQTARPGTKRQTQAKETAQPAPSGKSVCVASTLGHQFAVQKIGMTVFGNALDKIAIDSWGIDEAAVRRIGQIAGKGYAVRRIAIPAAAAAEPNAPFSGWLSNPVEMRMRAIAAASPKCDVYVSLAPASRNYSTQHLTGLGIVDTSPIVDRIFVFASFSVVIHDGDTFSVLKVALPDAGLFSAGLMAAPSAMYQQVDRSWVPATPQTAAQNAQLKNATRALVEEGLSKALSGVFEGGA